MQNKKRSYLRLLMPTVATGMLLQAGGCDLANISSDLLGSVLTSVIGSFVFSSFNLI